MVTKGMEIEKFNSTKAVKLIYNIPYKFFPTLYKGVEKNEKR